MFESIYMKNDLFLVTYYDYSGGTFSQSVGKEKFTIQNTDPNQILTLIKKLKSFGINRNDIISIVKNPNEKLKEQVLKNWNSVK